MDARGASLRVLSVFAPGALRDPAWLPDGRQLADESKLSGTRVDAVTVELTGSGATRTLIPSAWGAAWSPSGRRIAFIRETGVRTMPSGRGRSRPIRIAGTFDDVGTTEDLAWVDLARR